MKLVTIIVSALAVTAMHAQRADVARTPPMGWNSWDAYGLTITEPQFRDNVKVLKEKLAPFGWNYAVIDEGWFFENPQDRETPAKLRYALDPFGRYVPVPERFPSAETVMVTRTARTIDPNSPPPAGPKLEATLEETSFAALGDWVHAQGLKFGIHIVRGIPRASVERNLPVQGSDFHAQDVADQTDACPWDPTNWGVKDNAAGQAWYDSLLRQYAAWGVDLLKVDCIADHPYKVDEVRMIRRAIDKTGRPMVLSLSPGPTNLSHAEEVSQLANMWRISDDIWDIWAKDDTKFPQTVKSQFARVAAWERYAKPSDWPDADMLPFGQLRPSPGWGKPRDSRLTQDEQYTQMTLWAMARSPLILGANLTLLDAATLTMLTNKGVIAIDQTSIENAEVLHENGLIAWRAKLPNGRVALALFNTSDATVQVDRTLADFDVSLAAHCWRLRDVWTGDVLSDGACPGRSGVIPKQRIRRELRPHASLLVVLEE
jgi:hypothetical protein